MKLTVAHIRNYLNRLGVGIADGKTVSGFPALEIDLWRRCMVRLKQLGKK